MDPIDFIVSHGSMESNLKVEYFAFSVKVAIFSSISDRSVFKVRARRNACDKFASNAQKEIFETKQIEEHITKLKDTFEFVEKHGSDKQAFLLARTLKTDLSDICNAG
jgi:hypothetical protein